MSSSSTPRTATKTAGAAADKTIPPPVGSRVQVKIVRGSSTTFEVAPDDVQVHYFHGAESGHAELAHRVQWVFEGLAPDERVEIRFHLDKVKVSGKKLRENRGAEVLAELFPTSELMKDQEDGARLSRGWTIPSSPLPTLDTGDLRLAARRGRIEAKYSLRLLSKSGEIAFLDPGGTLIPDP